MSIAVAEALAGVGAAEAGAAEAGAAGGGSRVGNFFDGAQDHLTADNLPIPGPRPAPVGTAAHVAAGTVNPHAVL